MSNKSHGELQEMAGGIKVQLESGECADPEYWEAVRRRLNVHLAMARLRDIHRSLQERYLASREGDVPQQMGWEDDAEADDGGVAADPNAEAMPPPAARDPEQQQQQLAATPLVRQRLTYDPESMSPPRLSEADCRSEDVVDEEDDMQLMLQLRAQVEYHASGKFRAARDMMPSGSSSDADAVYQRMLNPHRGGGPVGVPVMLRNVAVTEDQPTFRSGKEPELEEEKQEEANARQMATSVSKMMGDDAGAAQFSVEYPLASQVYWWHDKYRPRKPKYFNRVHTGYEWNKYNQTHYDHDNPPPKVVQGYKFNIFYPDLIEKKKAPTYKLEKDPASRDGQTCILRFSAGPPYEDIAFKIVNKEWEYAHKKGFKCSFERGIMHLYFNFKRSRYRR